MRRLLHPTGTLYFHIDWREAHYCKLLLDELFGRECFLNELIWAYDYGAKPRRRWPPKHDTILVYVKDPRDYFFDAEAVDREPYMAPGLVTPEKAARGKRPTDVMWHTIVSPTGREKTGYPTQKPEGLLRRFVQASSRPGDLCLDPFAGSGHARRGGREPRPALPADGLEPAGGPGCDARRLRQSRRSRATLVLVLPWYRRQRFRFARPALLAGLVIGGLVTLALGDRNSQPAHPRAQLGRRGDRQRPGRGRRRRHADAGREPKANAEREAQGARRSRPPRRRARPPRRRGRQRAARPPEATAGTGADAHADARRARARAAPRRAAPRRRQAASRSQPRKPGSSRRSRRPPKPAPAPAPAAPAPAPRPRPRRAADPRDRPRRHRNARNANGRPRTPTATAATTTIPARR